MMSYLINFLLSIIELLSSFFHSLFYLSLSHSHSHSLTHAHLQALGCTRTHTHSATRQRRNDKTNAALMQSTANWHFDCTGVRIINAFLNNVQPHTQLHIERDRRVRKAASIFVINKDNMCSHQRQKSSSSFLSPTHTHWMLYRKKEEETLSTGLD